MDRYFYRLGQFTKQSQKKVYDIHEGAISGVRFEYVVDKKFDNCGWDVRSWNPDNALKEITKKDYEEIVKLENDIIKQQKELGLEPGHHFPIKLNANQVSIFETAGIKIIPL